MKKLNGEQLKSISGGADAIEFHVIRDLIVPLNLAAGTPQNIGPEVSAFAKSRHDR